MSAARRWYRHGLNRPLSWELVLRIPPRLPRLALVPLHHVATLACMLCMTDERTSARRNLRRVSDARGLAGLRLLYRLFHNFSRFMVAYADMSGHSVDELQHRLIDAGAAERSIRAALAEGRGAILATMHIGQWDLGLKLLSRLDVPVHVVMFHEDAQEVTRYADAARAWPKLRVHRMGSSRMLAVELAAALRRGELVAIQIDRPIGPNVVPVEFFGAVTSLPAGPVMLALATGAPVLPVFVLFDRDDRFRLVSLPPLRFERDRGEDEIQRGLRRLVEVMESIVARYPDQWFNFYDVWPDERAP
jgi:KDO2-lipid IV(A) lauroyltransferase